MQLGFNVMFGGNCREAVMFYAKALGLEEPQFLTYGEGDTSFDTNVKNSSQNDNNIMFSSLTIGTTDIIFNDMPDNFEFIKGNSFGITVLFENANEAQKVFSNLSEGGMVFVPFAEVTGQGYYGMLGDKFDVSWTIKA